MASMAAKNSSWCVGVVSLLEPSRAAAARRSGHAVGPGPARLGRACAVSGLLPGLHPVAVAARGSAQLEFGIEAGRACLSHQREQLRPDVADAVRLRCAAWLRCAVACCGG